MLLLEQVFLIIMKNQGLNNYKKIVRIFFSILKSLFCYYEKKEIIIIKDSMQLKNSYLFVFLNILGI